MILKEFLDKCSRNENVCILIANTQFESFVRQPQGLFVLTKMIDYRNKVLAVFHVLSRHCGVLVSLNEVINGKKKE